MRFCHATKQSRAIILIGFPDPSKQASCEWRERERPLEKAAILIPIGLASPFTMAFVWLSPQCSFPSPSRTTPTCNTNPKNSPKPRQKPHLFSNSILSLLLASNLLLPNISTNLPNPTLLSKNVQKTTAQQVQVLKEDDHQQQQQQESEGGLHLGPEIVTIPVEKLQQREDGVDRNERTPAAADGTLIVPKDSDLGRLLSGEVTKLPGENIDPRAHGR